MEIGHVENLPTELQILAFPRHLPSFAQSHIQTRIPISSNHVSRTGLAGEGMLEVVESSHRIDENAHGTVGRISVMPDLGSNDHLTDTLPVPVCRPEVAVINRKGEAAGPPGHARKLPASDQSISNAGGVSEALSVSKWQRSDPVQVDLVSGIEIRHSSAPVRIERIRQSSSRGAHVATRCPQQAGRRRGNVTRFR